MEYNQNTQAILEYESYFITDFGEIATLRKDGIYRVGNIALGWTYDAIKKTGFKEIKIHKNN
jgi:hypothetical protein